MSERASIPALIAAMERVRSAAYNHRSGDEAQDDDKLVFQVQMLLLWMHRNRDGIARGFKALGEKPK